jgi:arsenate reductase
MSRRRKDDPRPCAISSGATARIVTRRQRTHGIYPMIITMYGIKNCDTIKKARAWLDGRGIEYRFHDYKAAGIDRARLERWIDAHGWEALCNRAGTTFRKLPDADKQDLSASKAIALMLQHPSIIKRPVLEIDEQVLVGFDVDSYTRAVRR